MTERLIADYTEMTDGFCCFTTNREFDLERMGWKDASGKVADLLGRTQALASANIAFAGQVHGNRVVTIIEDKLVFPALVHDCDGLATSCRGVFLVIRTADCLPIVLVDPKRHVCGACHAGWRGTYGRVLEQLIEAMEGLGADRSRLKGWIGPGISQQHYEVSVELADRFQEAFGAKNGFLDGRNLNLPLLNQFQAERSGVKKGNLQDCGLCTYSNPDTLYSHRREGRDRGHLFTVCGFLT